MPGNASRTPCRWLDPHFIPMGETCQLKRSGGNTVLSVLGHTCKVMRELHYVK